MAAAEGGEVTTSTVPTQMHVIVDTIAEAQAHIRRVAAEHSPTNEGAVSRDVAATVVSPSGELALSPRPERLSPHPDQHPDGPRWLRRKRRSKRRDFGGTR